MNQQPDTTAPNFAAFNSHVEAEMEEEAMLARERDEGVLVVRGVPKAATLALGASLPQMISPNPTTPLPTSQAAFRGALFAAAPLLIPGLLEVFAAGKEGWQDALGKFAQRIIATMFCGSTGSVLWSTIYASILRYGEEISAAWCNGDSVTILAKWLVVSILSCDQPSYAETTP